MENNMSMEDTQNTQVKNEKQNAIGIIGILMMIGGIISLVVFPIFMSSSIILSMMLYLMILLYISTGYGLLKRIKIAWYISLFLYLITFFGLITNSKFNLNNLFSIIYSGIFYFVIIYYLLKPNTRKYFDIHPRKDFIYFLRSKQKIPTFFKTRKKKKITILTILVLHFIFLIFGFTPTGETTITDISYIPIEPHPEDTITFYANVTGGSLFEGVKINFRYIYLDDGRGGGKGKIVLNFFNNKISTLSPSYKDTDLWFMIQENNEIIKDEVIQICQVKRDNSTSLTIDGVTQFEEPLSINTEYITINASVISNVTISKVNFACIIFYNDSWHHTDRIFNEMDLIDKNVYYYTYSLIDNHKYHYQTLTNGTMIFYRIFAEDELGNVAITDSFKVEV